MQPTATALGTSLTSACGTRSTRSAAQTWLLSVGSRTRTSTVLAIVMGSTSGDFEATGGIASVRTGLHGTGASSPGAHGDPGRADGTSMGGYRDGLLDYLSSGSGSTPTSSRSIQPLGIGAGRFPRDPSGLDIKALAILSPEHLVAQKRRTRMADG